MINVSDRISDMGQRVSETVHERTREARDWASDIMRDYPLAVGAGFFMLGIACAVLIPATRREDRLMGGTRDDILRRAREAGEELLHEGGDTAEQAPAANDRDS